MKKELQTRAKNMVDFFLVFFTTYFVYLLTVYPTVGTEDSGELIGSAVALDIAHPPGYPLHTLLGKLFTLLIPFGNMAWRVNLLSVFFGAATVAIFYLIIKKLSKSDLIALAISLFFAFSDIFWSQSIRAETYTLSTFFLVLIIYLLIQWDASQKNSLLYAVAFCYGLSLTNQHTMFLAGPPIVIYVLMRNWRVILNIKTIVVCLSVFFLGLTVYFYLPIRSSWSYDNPAYIKHESLATFEKFFDFVNRKVYGGTIHATTEETEKSLPIIIIDAIGSYLQTLGTNNVIGFMPMIKRIFAEFFYLPILLFIPGLYRLLKKNKKIAILLITLFIFYTSVQLLFIQISSNMIPFNLFTSRPFMISSIVIVGIIMAEGFACMNDYRQKKKISLVYFSPLFLLPFFTLITNFYANNESHNYVAYDFNRHLLESLPLDAYFLSTGKDNITFPLYYLQKIEKIRTDIDLEIYYGNKPINENYLKQKLKEKNLPTLFIDLLPPGHLSMNLHPYNFVFAYGDTSTLSSSQKKLFTLRGMRPTMDYFNNRLKGLYYIKIALQNASDKEKMNTYLEKIRTEVPDNEELYIFMKEYLDGVDTTEMS